MFIYYCCDFPSVSAYAFPQEALCTLRDSRTMNRILKHDSSHRGAHYLYLVDNIPVFTAATIRCGGGFKMYFAHAGR